MKCTHAYINIRELRILRIYGFQIRFRPNRLYRVRSNSRKVSTYSFNRNVSMRFIYFVIIMLFKCTTSTIRPNTSFFSTAINCNGNRQRVFLVNKNCVSSHLFSNYCRLFRSEGEVIRFLVFVIVSFHFSIIQRGANSKRINVNPIRFRLMFPFRVLPYNIRNVIRKFFRTRREICTMESGRFCSLISKTSGKGCKIRRFVNGRTITPRYHFFNKDRFIGVCSGRTQEGLRTLLFTMERSAYQDSVQWGNLFVLSRRLLISRSNSSFAHRFFRLQVNTSMNVGPYRATCAYKCFVNSKYVRG